MPPGAHHKSAALSTSEICLQEFKVKEDHVLCLFENIKIKSNLKITSKTITNWNGSWFSLSIMSITFFYLSPPSSSLLFLICLLSLFKHTWSQHVASNVLPCLFLVSGKPTAWLFTRVLIPRDQTKKLMDVMTACCRYKHLSRHTIRPVLAGKVPA